MAVNMELKAYKKLSEIRGSILSTIISKSRNAVEYKKDKPEDLFEIHEAISKYEKWDYHGISSKKQQAELELLEYLLNDYKPITT